MVRVWSRLVVRAWSRRVVSSQSPLAIALALVTTLGCSASTAPEDAGGSADASGARDATAHEDAPRADDDAFVTTDAAFSSDAVTSPDAFVPSDAFTCSIGGRCNDANPCPGDWRCYGFGDEGFCAPFAPECGGIVMTPCETGLRCLRAGGSSLGYCADPSERFCICEAAIARGFSVDGC